MENSKFILFFDKTNITDIEILGGKNATLGKMYKSIKPSWSYYTQWFCSL